MALGSPLAAQLSQYEIDHILFLKEEEKLAHDVYITLGQAWNLSIFQNIARAETVHMSQVDGLLDTYGLADPALEGIGRFQNPVLQYLYDQLTTEGARSIRTALGAGEFIEIIDIKDLDDMIATTTSSSITVVAERLLAGSRNHLASFRRQLELLPAPFPDTAASTELVNLSARGLLGQGDASLIGGFVIEGTTPIQILLTVRGPSLASYGVSDPAQDPTLELFSGEDRLVANDDWQNGASADLDEQADLLGLAPTESAVLINLDPGAYTFVASNQGQGSIGLIEVYSWPETSADARLTNLSVRGQSGSGEERLIAGFTVNGSGPMPVAIRALGPTLDSFDVPNAMEQPILQIFRDEAPIQIVDDWLRDGILGSVPSNYWPDTILEPLEVVLQDSGSVTVHVTNQTDEPGIVLIDVTSLEL